MGVLKTFLKVIICIVLVPIILGFSIIIQTKDAVENQFIVEAIKQVVSNDLEKVKIDDKTLDEITNTDDANKLIETLILEYSKYTEDSTYKVSDEAVEMLINFCLENEEALEKLSEEDLDFDELRKPEAKEEIQKAIDESFRDLNADGQEEIGMIVYGYAQLTSKATLIKIAAVILGLIAVIALLSWSAYKWMIPVGIVGIVTGTLTLIMYAAFNFLSNLLKEEIGLEISVKLLLIFGVVEFVLGLAFVITRSVLDSNAKTSKLEKENESVISEPEEKIEVEPDAPVTSETETKETDEN